MSSSNSPCAACKCLRRKCTQECVFAPYFPPDNPQKFTNVHKVFGASNVAKLLNELNAGHREDAVNSLAYEAEYRLRDPVYGCVGLISMLQNKLKQVLHDLEAAKKELAAYIGPTNGLPPMMNQSEFNPQNPGFGPSSAFQMMPYNNNMQPMMGLSMGVPHHGAQLVIMEPQPQQQFVEAQQLAAAAAREQEMLRSYEHQQNDLGRFSFDDPVTATGFHQMQAGAGAATMQPSLALRSSYENVSYHHIQQHANVAEHSHSHSHQLQLQPQAELLPQQQQQCITAHHHQPQLAQPLRAKSEEGKSVGPTC